MSSIGLTQLQHYAAALDALNQLFKPHPKQVEAGRHIFKDGKKSLFLQFGRRCGKSSLACYIAVRWALTNSKSQIYVVAPLLNQAREVYLHSGLLASMCPPEFLAGPPNKTEARFTFTNGSFIRVLGADDPDSIRGVKCSLLILDEIKDIRPEYLDAAEPALADEDAPVVYCGTPPETAAGDEFFWKLSEKAKTEPEWAYVHATSYDNPYIKHEVIDRRRAQLERRGDIDVFHREYLAEFVPGAKKAVFGMFDDERHIRPYPELWQKVQVNPGHWDLVAALDPGTASTFACLLMAIDRFHGQVLVLDEIYATTQLETSIGAIWPRILRAMKEISPYEDDEEALGFSIVVDEAATWARNELLDRFNVASMPTHKASNRKAAGVGLIKDLLLSKHVAISDRCPNLVREMKAYSLDKLGNFIKGNDHALDAFRYGLHAGNFTWQETTPPVPPEQLPPDERRRAYTPSQDFAELTATGADYLYDLE